VRARRQADADVDPSPHLRVKFLAAGIPHSAGATLPVAEDDGAHGTHPVPIHGARHRGDFVQDGIDVDASLQGAVTQVLQRQDLVSRVLTMVTGGQVDKAGAEFLGGVPFAWQVSLKGASSAPRL
jgi:hypothetical protein